MNGQVAGEKHRLVFRTQGADPGHLKPTLDEVCGEGRYRVKLIAADRWVLITDKRLSLTEQDKINRETAPEPLHGSPELPAPPSRPLRTNTSFGPISRAATTATQKSRKSLHAALHTSFMEYIRKLPGMRRNQPRVAEPEPEPEAAAKTGTDLPPWPTTMLSPTGPSSPSPSPSPSPSLGVKRVTISGKY